MQGLRFRSGLARLIALFLGTFVLYNVVEDFSFFRVTAYQLSRKDLVNPLFNASVYAGAYLCAVLALAILYGHASRAVRHLAQLLTLITLAVFLGFRAANGYGFTAHEAAVVLSALEFIPGALEFFSGVWVGPALLALGLVLVLEWFARFRGPAIRSLTLCLLAVAATWMFHDIIQTTRGKVYQAPIPYRVPLLLHYAFLNRMPYYGPREEPRMAPTRDPIADHVVFLVDESIRGDFLGVNGSSYDTTPFLDSIRDEIFNFGVISSVSNLSDSANIVLQSGLRPDQFPDTALRSLKNPSIFSYAQRAGFKAFLIDGQIYSEHPQNFLTGFDLRGLDGYLLVKQLDRGLRIHEVDRRIIDYLVEIVSENERSFTYVVKVGSHFPYEDCYPIEETFFTPTRAMNTGSEQERTVNSYLNSLRWGADGFLRELLQALGSDGEEVLLVYTSDHGQSFWETLDEWGKPGRGGHGTLIDPPDSQARVPLMLLTPHQDVRARLSDLYEPSVKDRASAFELFPSLLYLIGYDEGDIRRYYYHTIFDAEADRSGRGFISGNLFGIGSTSTWNDFASGRGSG